MERHSTTSCKQQKGTCRLHVPLFSAERSEKRWKTESLVVTIIVADKAAVPQVNACLHEYGSHIIGRLGVPYGEKGVSVICVIMDAPGTAVSALSGKLGMLAGVSAKTVTAKV